MKKKTSLILLLSALATVQTAAQSATAERLTDGLRYKAEAQVSISDGATPLWLNANKYGLSSLDKTNGYLRAAIERPLAADSARRWAVGYGLDVAVPFHYTSHFVVQQAFAEVGWLHGLFTVGSKEQPMELRNGQLSTGSQTLGINARPVPMARLSLPDYWELPFAKGWLGLKGHVAYGMTTDDKWQKDFTHQQKRYTEKTLLHTKAGYLRIGRTDKPLTVELGLEMACQFGGTMHAVNNDPSLTMEGEKGLSGMLKAFVPGGSDATDAGYENASGNHLGSLLARVNYQADGWKLGVYADHYFEDHSSMLMLDYDGYGSGAEWDTKKDNRYFLYDFKDLQLGAELNLKRGSWLRDIVVEYVYSKYQSGPVYHDHTQSISTHISGRDDYYNHNLYTGWQHWGMVMGNPLYRSPLYNDDGAIDVRNNRFVAWHLGLSGAPLPGLDYRLLATWQKGYGTYNLLFDNPKENVSLLAEASYSFPERSRMAGWALQAAVGMDRGGIYGDNTGVQLTVRKTGLLTRKRK